MDVWRGIRKGSYREYEDGWIAFEVFLRNARDLDGVSIGQTPESVMTRAPGSAGLAVLPIFEINQINSAVPPHKLAVVFDEPPHGYIGHVPFAHVGLKIAEKVAGDLARIASLMPRDKFAELKKEALNTK
ncbi:MAG: hypothetical protein M3Y24_10770 [Acidobacteriota bacterium]|nr:hypothetical protein [Acidobacteriota bacterium]